MAQFQIKYTEELLGMAVEGTMNGNKEKNGKTKFVYFKCGKVFEKKI